MKKLTFVIPCYNSEKMIGTVVEEIIEVVRKCGKYDYEIILVNDFSADDTYKEIQRLCFENRKIKGLGLSQNYGQPSAMMAGYEIATGDIIVHSDDDGQTPIDELEKLLNKLEDGYDMVFAQFTVKRNSILQNFGTRLNNLMANYLLNKPKDVHMGNFWVCRSFVVKEAIKCRNPYPYLAGIFLGITKNIGMVTTSHRKRISGESNYTLRKMIALWLNGFTAFSVKPLRIASILGFITAIIGFVYILVIIYNKIAYPAIPIGYSSIMSVLIFIGGMIMLMLGMIGEYIGRIYININNKPQYVIREMINVCDENVPITVRPSSNLKE